MPGDPQPVLDGKWAKGTRGRAPATAPRAQSARAGREEHCRAVVREVNSFHGKVGDPNMPVRGPGTSTARYPDPRLARPFQRRIRPLLATHCAPMSVCDHCATELPDAARFCFVCGRDVVATVVAAHKPHLEADAIGKLRAQLAKSLDGRYKLREILALGGMACFLADDLSLDRRVAIKVLPTELSGDKSVVARFAVKRRPPPASNHRNHPGARGGKRQRLHYFVMKHVTGDLESDVA